MPRRMPRRMLRQMLVSKLSPRLQSGASRRRGRWHLPSMTRRTRPQRLLLLLRMPFLQKVPFLQRMPFLQMMPLPPMPPWPPRLYMRLTVLQRRQVERRGMPSRQMPSQPPRTARWNRPRRRVMTRPRALRALRPFPSGQRAARARWSNRSDSSLASSSALVPPLLSSSAATCCSP